MKKRSISLLLLLSLLAALTSCAQQGTPRADWLPETADSVDVTCSYAAETMEWTLTGREVETLRGWLADLELNPAHFDEGETPGDTEGDTAWSFSVNGGDVTFFYLESGYLCHEDMWYAVSGPDFPWQALELEEMRNPVLPPEETVPEGVRMEVLDLQDGILTVRLKNAGGAVYEYGVYYTLLWETDGHWSERTPEEEYGVEDILYTLAGGEQREHTFDLTPYGALEGGRYRLLLGELTADFVLSADGALDRVTLTVLGVADGKAEVLLSNPGPEDADYGWSCVIEQQDVSGRWVELPLTGDVVGVCGNKDLLHAGETIELSLDVSQYGEISPGHYRLRMDMDHRAAEFTIA